MDSRHPGRCLEVSIGEGRLRVLGTATWLGEDLLVWITGGTKAHIGAAALAVAPLAAAPPDVAGGGLAPALSLITVPGHREDGIVLDGAAYLAREIGRTVLVTAGIHVDAASRGEIETLVDHADQVVKALGRLAGGETA